MVSGIDDFKNVGEKDIRAALPYLTKAGIPLYVHAELVDGRSPEVPCVST
jgi:hypothetical protein